MDQRIMHSRTAYLKLVVNAFQPGARLLIFISVICASALLCPSLSQAADTPPPNKGIVFWIGSDNNGIFDALTTKFISERAGIVVLNIHKSGQYPEYDYPTIVQRFHKFARPLIILYNWVYFRYKTPRIGTDILDNAPEDCLLHFPNGRVFSLDRQGNIVAFNLGLEACRRWLIDRNLSFMNMTQTDGLVFDMAVRSPYKELSSICGARPDICRDYPKLIDGYFDSLHRNMQNKLLLYNALSNVEENEIADQIKLLEYTDGAGIEHFGMVPYKKRSDFKRDILPYLDAVQHHPDKYFLFFGRGPYAYTDYTVDYLSQRYLFCWYCLIANSRTFFKYHSVFQVPPDPYRAGGLDVYGDWDLTLGQPDGQYSVRGELYSRKFANGLVLVVPDSAQTPEFFQVPGTLFTPEGIAVSGGIKVMPGQGLLLLNEKPKPARPLQVSFEKLEGVLDWPFAKISHEDSTVFLHTDKLPEGRLWEHDLLLDPVRTLSPPGILGMKLRLRDRDAELLLVAEVDDQQRKVDHVVFRVADGDPKNTHAVQNASLSFRSPEGARSIPVIECKTLSPGQSWQNLRIDGPTDMTATKRFTFRRWSFVRFVGSLDLVHFTLD